MRHAGLLLLCFAAGSSVATAQNLSVPTTLLPGYEADSDELLAWQLVQETNNIRAREQAERVLKRKPNSYVAHLVLGHVQHYAEVNFPRALFHLDLARGLYEEEHSGTPQQDQPWRWHAALLRQLGSTHGDLEHHADKLAYIALFNTLYEPDMIAERAWPLMKLGRYTEARLAAELGLNEVTRPIQRTYALNALCAIEFEAGNDGASYDACKAAVDDRRDQGLPVSAVDLTNLAEAARSLFRLDEAERLNLEAAEAQVSWYGNPWMELSELYTRQARFMESLSALREVPGYRKQRPPHVMNADRNELRRALSSLLLAIAKPHEAMEVTESALLAPDRRSHNSRDASQDRSVIALLDRRARLMAAEMRMEKAATERWYARPLGWLEALWGRLQARRSGALVERLLDDDDRLVGTFKLGTAHSAITPPWLAGEFVSVLGPGVTAEALRRARAADTRAAAGPYYDAMSAEVAWRSDEPQRALELADRAIAGLTLAEALLRARVEAIAADAANQLGHWQRAAPHYDAAFQSDPGIFRRLGIAVPVRIGTVGGDGAEQAASMIASSPRFEVSDSGLSIRVESDGYTGSACLSGEHNALIGCGRASAEAGDDAHALAARIVAAFHDEAFSPRVDMTQTDINSLDGRNLVGKEALESLFD